MSGSVVLVGAGPGNLGLLTLRGRQAIETAELVLYDRLVGPEILALIPDAAERIDVGKSAGRHPIPQSEINALILGHAMQGKHVVRLKGGDPYLFGRGAEELEGVIAAGLPFEVVPGVTSATSVPAFAGIPVTHRSHSSSVHIITAHRKNSEEPVFDYEALVRLGGTLIFLMGLATMPRLIAGLMDAGMPRETPAALIENGTRPEQRRLVATVGSLAELAKQQAFQSPAIVMVGSVVSLAGKFDWFAQLPLHGVGIVVTRPENEGRLSRELRALGAHVTDFPCIKTRPLPLPGAVFDSLADYGWIVFTSPYGAESFFAALKTRKIDIRGLCGVRFAAVGAKTAAVIEQRGIVVDFVPKAYNGRALAAGLPEGANKRTLLFRARDGARALADTLRSRGFAVEDVAAYETLLGSPRADEVRERMERGGANCVTFTSGSTVQGFTAALPGLDCTKLTAVCIGAETAALAREHGFRVLVSKQATIESLVELIREEYEK